MKQIIILLLGIFIIPFTSYGKLPVGQKPPAITLSGESGGLLDGSSWSSQALSGKVYGMMYIDPDKVNVNEHLKTVLKNEKFPQEKVSWVFVVNFDATWIPDTLIESTLQQNQKQYPDLIFVKDFDRSLVKQWNLKDDCFDVLVFDHSGSLVFNHEGELSDQKVQQLVQVIWKHTD